jgi:hypothetical protein
MFSDFVRHEGYQGRGGVVAAPLNDPAAIHNPESPELQGSVSHIKNLRFLILEKWIFPSSFLFLQESQFGDL